MPNWPRALQANKQDAKGKGKINESIQVKNEVEDMDVDNTVSFVLALTLSLTILKTTIGCAA